MQRSSSPKIPCRTGPISVCASYDKTVGPFTTLRGTIKLSPVLRNIITMHVTDVTLRCDSGLTFGVGFQFKLKSAVLAAKLKKNNFYVASSTDSNLLNAVPDSDTISIHSIADMTDNFMANFNNLVNQKLFFSTPVD